MSGLVNLHTHTSFCDGENTPAEMAKAAYNKGFKCLGFSGHAPMRIRNTYCMSSENLQAYRSEVVNLKHLYKDKMGIFLGLEADYFADSFERKDYDYIIGSVHHVYYNDFYLCIDSSPIDLVIAINVYKNNINALIYDYYKQVADIPNRFKADIIGHFDIIAKYNLNNKFFDENDSFYQKCALGALESVVDKGLYLEINTGAINKPGVHRIYPSKFILKYANKIGAKIVISSDSHAAKTLNSGFENAACLAKECGYKTAYKLSETGFCEFDLDNLIK